MGSQSRGFSPCLEMLLPIVICCLVTNSSLTQRRKEPPGCCCSQVCSLDDVGSPCGLGSAQHCGCAPTPSVWGREPGRSPAPSRRAARSPGPHPRQTPSVAAVPRPLQSKGREQNWKVLEELWGGQDHCGAFGKQNLFLRQEGSGLDGFLQVTGPHRTPPFTDGKTGSEREQSGRSSRSQTSPAETRQSPPGEEELRHLGHLCHPTPSPPYGPLDQIPGQPPLLTPSQDLQGRLALHCPSPADLTARAQSLLDWLPVPHPRQGARSCQAGHQGSAAPPLPSPAPTPALQEWKGRGCRPPGPPPHPRGDRRPGGLAS